MLTFIIKRLLNVIPTLAVLITITFFMIRSAPGGPFDGDRPIPPDILENLLKTYHMDKPLGEQFLLYVKNLLQGDFGPSMKLKDLTVVELLADSFPVSLELGFFAIILAFLIGTPMGMLAALNQNKRLDYSIMFFAMFGIVIPSFVFAPYLSKIFGIWLQWLPVGQWGDGAIEYKILPVIALALPQIAYISRLTRGSMIEVMRSNFIRTAKAKGLSYTQIVIKHALKPTIMPIISYLGPATAAIVTGSVVIEKIFSLPGTGTYFVQSAFNRDYTLVMGLTIFYGMLIIFMNLIVDLLYGVLDPRIKYK